MKQDQLHSPMLQDVSVGGEGHKPHLFHLKTFFIQYFLYTILFLICKKYIRRIPGQRQKVSISEDRLLPFYYFGGKLICQF